MRGFTRAACLFVIAGVFACLSVAQPPSPPPPEPQPALQSSLEELSAVARSTAQPRAAPNPQLGKPQQPASPSGAEQEKQVQKKEQSQRILGVVPQFSVTSRQNARPLTSGQKFHLFVKSAFDPFQFGLAGFQAGISQATNSFPGYGQGAAGYAKRFGAAFADRVSTGFFSNFAYPALLKQDPRYFRLGEGSTKHRIFYSLAQEFVCRTDKGKRSFNYSRVLGILTAGGLSNAYYPSADRGFGLTMSRSAISLAYGSAGNLIDEFWFDINERLFHKHKKQPPTSAAPPPPTQDH